MNKEFRNFALGDVFDFKAIKQAKSQREIPDDACGVLYVVQSTVNNMVSRVVNRQWLIDNNEPPVPGNAIVLGVTLPAVSYQPIEFGASQVIVARNKYLNEKIGIYLVGVLKKRMSEFSYSKKPGMAIYKAMIIPFPVIEHSDPNYKYTVDDIDWQYMEDRIKELEEDRIKELDAYLKATNLDDYELIDEDKKVLSLSRKSASNENGSLENDCKNGTLRFKKFVASDLFDIKKGKRLTKADMIVGDINFVGSSSSNNGITAKIGNTECIHSANTISVSYNGSVGEVFLQEEPFWASDDVNVWYPKFTFNARVIEYIMSVIKKCRKKYSYSAKWTLDKMKIEELELPVTADGEPDFDYMERYIRAIEKLTIADVVKYKDKIIDTTKKLVNNQS